MNECSEYFGKTEWMFWIFLAKMNECSGHFGKMNECSGYFGKMNECSWYFGKMNECSEYFGKTEWMFWIFLAKMNECSGHFGTQKFLTLISLAKHCKKITLTFFELFYYYFLFNRCKTSTVLRKSSIICNTVFPVHHQIISVDKKYTNCLQCL